MSVFKDFPGLENLEKIQGLSRTRNSPVIGTPPDTPTGGRSHRLIYQCLSVHKSGLLVVVIATTYTLSSAVLSKSE